MKVAREFLSFAVVGVIGFGVDVGVLYLAAPLSAGTSRGCFPLSPPPPPPGR